MRKKCDDIKCIDMECLFYVHNWLLIHCGCTCHISREQCGHHSTMVLYVHFCITNSALLCDHVKLASLYIRHMGLSVVFEWIVSSNSSSQSALQLCLSSSRIGLCSDIFQSSQLRARPVDVPT